MQEKDDRWRGPKRESGERLEIVDTINLTEDSDTTQKVLDVLNVTVAKVRDKIIDSYNETGDMITEMHGIVAKKKEEDDLAERKKTKFWKQS